MVLSCTTFAFSMINILLSAYKNICKNISKPETKFTMDMIYGIFKSKNIFTKNRNLNLEFILFRFFYYDILIL